MAVLAENQRVRSRSKLAARPLALLIVLLLVIFVPVAFQSIFQWTDYRFHIPFAQYWAENGALRQPVPHLLYHALLVVFQAILPGANFEFAAFVLNIAMFLVTGILIYTFLLPALDQVSSRRAPTLAIAMTLGLMLLSAITMLSWSTTELYFGYIVTNAYHNPTILLLRPLALLQFIYTLKIFDKSATARTVVLTLILTVLSANAKPNYLIAICPAIGLITLYRLVRRESIHWPLLIIGFAIPTGVVLGAQLLLFTSQLDSQIIFAPFESLKWYTDGLPLKFILSILFPLAVYVAYFKQARQSLYLNLAWLTFVFGSFYMYFFSESYDPKSGNFWWSGQSTLFILFIATAYFFLNLHQTRLFGRGENAQRDARLYLSLGIFGLHLVAGLLWYYLHVTGQMGFETLLAGREWRIFAANGISQYIGGGWGYALLPHLGWW
jgi:hypothetical protein